MPLILVRPERDCKYDVHSKEATAILAAFEGPCYGLSVGRLLCLATGAVVLLRTVVYKYRYV